MFDWLDPAGSIASKALGVPKTGVSSQEDPRNIGEMIASRIPGAYGGSIAGDASNMVKGQAESADQKKKRLNAQGVYKAGGKVKSASARADGCCIRGKTRA
jgi:hypothetical protein